MHVTYQFRTVLNNATKASSISDGRNFNYQITMDREYALKLYAMLQKEFG